MKNSKKFTEWLKVFQSQNESQKRWLAALKSKELGYGGIKIVAELTGLTYPTIRKGRRDLESKKTLNEDRLRREGGGRKKITKQESKIVKTIESILNENTIGDPMSKLKWTCKSSRSIADELIKKNINISYRTVCRILADLDYSLQANRKIQSGEDHPDRDDQFKLINRTVKKFMKNNLPIISVDTKKKEQVGNFKNNGKVWSKKGKAKKVFDHDFKSLGHGTAVPYGIYDIQHNDGFVNVGKSADTAEFAVNSIKHWWKTFASKRYPDANQLLICADGGGSNGSSNRAWKIFLQKLSNDENICITVRHFPPGTSKWNKIEHRMFSFISLNWKGVPLNTYETVINLIAGTTTKAGLKIKARLDKKKYEKGLVIPPDFLDHLEIEFHRKYHKWNYSISPNLEKNETQD